MNKQDKFPQAKGTLIRRIEAACEGLNYMSETDAGVEPFVTGKASAVTAEELAKAGFFAAGELVETADKVEFFERVTKVRKWYTPEQRKNARGFEKLRQLLESELSDLKVFRVGAVRVKIYAAGLDADGNLAGVRTEAVET